MKEFFESKGILVYLEEVEKTDVQGCPEGYYVKIEYSDLSRALSLIEEKRLFSYNNQETYMIDDGR